MKRTKKAPKKVKAPLVKIVIRDAANHSDATADSIQTWMAGIMLDYHLERGNYDKVMTARYFRA